MDAPNAPASPPHAAPCLTLPGGETLSIRSRQEYLARFDTGLKEILACIRQVYDAQMLPNDLMPENPEQYINEFVGNRGRAIRRLFEELPEEFRGWVNDAYNAVVPVDEELGVDLLAAQAILDGTGEIHQDFVRFVANKKLSGTGSASTPEMGFDTRRYRQG